MRRPTLAETVSFVIAALVLGWILLWVRAWLRVAEIPFMWTIWNAYVLILVGALIVAAAADLLFNWSGNAGTLRGRLMLLLRTAVALPVIYGLDLAIRSAQPWVISALTDIVLAVGYVGALSTGIRDVLRTEHEPSPGEGRP